MPINSVRNPLLNPHESSVLVFTIEDLHSYAHAQIQTLKETHRNGEGEVIASWEEKKGQMGSI